TESPPRTPLRSWGRGAGSALSAGLREFAPHPMTKDTRGSSTSTATATSRSSKETPYAPGSATGSRRSRTPPPRRRAPGSTTRIRSRPFRSTPGSSATRCGGAAATRCTWKTRAASATNTRSSASNDAGRSSREQADHQAAHENGPEERGRQEEQHRERPDAGCSRGTPGEHAVREAPEADRPTGHADCRGHGIARRLSNEEEPGKRDGHTRDESSLQWRDQPCDEEGDEEQREQEHRRRGVGAFQDLHSPSPPRSRGVGGRKMCAGSGARPRSLKAR